MSEAKHTPGPLFAGRRESVVIVTGSPEGPVLYRGLPDFTKADARLFAAAPQLLDALRILVTYHEDSHPDWRLARAAIAAATGTPT
jgi:hypothetical protein